MLANFKELMTHTAKVAMKEVLAAKRKKVQAKYLDGEENQTQTPTDDRQKKRKLNKLALKIQKSFIRAVQGTRRTSQTSMSLPSTKNNGKISRSKLRRKISTTSSTYLQT